MLMYSSTCTGCSADCWSILSAVPAAKLKAGILLAEENVAPLEAIGRDGLPYVMFFTIRHISPGQELLVDYGGNYWRNHTAKLNWLKALAVRLPCMLS